LTTKHAQNAWKSREKQIGRKVRSFSVNLLKKSDMFSFS